MFSGDMRLAPLSERTSHVSLQAESRLSFAAGEGAEALVNESRRDCNGDESCSMPKSVTIPGAGVTVGRGRVRVREGVSEVASAISSGKHESPHGLQS